VDRCEIVEKDFAGEEIGVVAVDCLDSQQREVSGSTVRTSVAL
jgi:hypothetical protein